MQVVVSVALKQEDVKNYLLGKPELNLTFVKKEGLKLIFETDIENPVETVKKAMKSNVDFAALYYSVLKM